MMPSMPLWGKYNRKIAERLQKLRYAGGFDSTSAAERNMRLVSGKAQLPEQGISLALYWLVDESDGVIADAKFQAIGPTALLAIADGICEMAIRKNYDQLSRLSAELIDRHLREKKEIPAFPEECSSLFKFGAGSRLQSRRGVRGYRMRILV